MRRDFVHSTNIESVGYEDGVLEIAFHGGGVYQYHGVPYAIYEALMRAPSKGQYFHSHIRDRYYTVKVG